MWRTNAVISMLVEDVAELRISASPDGSSEHAEATTERPEMEALTKATRRAIMVSLIDWIALVILLAFHSGPGPFLPLGPSTETVFTLGALAVAMHSGFRLGQARTYKAVSRVSEELLERQGD
jgi:hypothetical protein